MSSEICEYGKKKTNIHGHKPANVGSPCKISMMNKHRATYLASIIELRFSMYTSLDVSNL